MKKLMLLMVLISLFLVGIVYSAPHSLTLNTITWQENTKINISTKTTNDNSQVNITNLALFFSASDTANSTSKLVLNITNSSATNFDEGYANITFGNNIVLEDTVNGVVTSITTGVGDSANINLSSTTITIDRTVPQTSTTSHSANTEFDDSITKTITYTVNGANTTSCRIAFGKTTFTGTNTFAMTHSGNSCTYTISKAAIPDGTYKTYVRASDGTNTSMSTGIDFKIKTIEGVTSDDITSLSVPIVEKVVTEKINMGNVVLIAIFGTAIYFMFFRKKK